jgi:hypothetical protein
MAAGSKEDATVKRTGILGAAQLLFVFFLIVVFFILGKIAVFGNFLFLFFFVFIIIQIFGDDIQVDGMDLRHFQFGLALWATQNFSFFDLVFIDVDLGGTFRAADHDPSSVRDSKGRRRQAASTTVERIIYRREVNSIQVSRSRICMKTWRNRYTAHKWRPRESIRNGRW